MKTCKKCGELKPINEFHNRKLSKDGKVADCKSCAIARACAWQKSNAEKRNDYIRDRRLADIEGTKTLSKKCAVNYRYNHPEKVAARYAVRNSIRCGIISRPSSCSQCFKQCKPEAHHWSYLEEHHLDVVWLCRKCHVAEHKRMKESEIK